jgi:RHS repeat-associated protein
MELIAGDKVKIQDKLHLPKVNGLMALVTVKDQPCPNVKQSEGFNQQSEGFNQQSEGNFVYDNAGNLTYDPNKKLTFLYNHLNLPYKIVGMENDELLMIYGADGVLLTKKYIKSNQEVSKFDYIKDKIYVNSQLTSIYYSEGRILKNQGIYLYEYAISDGQGNYRVSFIDVNNDGFISSNEISYRNDYYAFGLEWQGGSKLNLKDQKIKFNTERESIMNMQLDLSAFRTFDPTLGRFLQNDPLAKHNESLYAAFANNPISFSDPFGLDTIPNVILPQITITASRTGGNYDQSAERYGYNGTFAQWQSNYGTRGKSYEQELSNWNEKYAGYHAYFSAQMDRIQRERDALGQLMWFKEAITTVGGFALGGLSPALTLPQGFSFISPVKSIGLIRNPVPSRLARVIPSNINSNTLGAPGTDDVFVTALDDIYGLSAKEIARRLTIPYNSVGFKIIDFPTPTNGLASPINRINPGFIGFGRTAGGAREFVIPNQNIPNGSNVKIKK